jgi:adenylosuccinate synthase
MSELGYEGSVVLLGGQYGDEGKGKIVDFLATSEDFSIVARGNGGPNAGHNIHGPDFDFPAHLMPSGIFSDRVVNVVGAGTVINPSRFWDEVMGVEELAGTIDPGRLFISPRAHVILPRHIEEDGATDKVGTTKQGIGPVYADKARRTGFQIGDLLNIRKNTDLDFGDSDPEKVEEMFEAMLHIGKFVVDPSDLVFDAVSRGKRVLVEGAQGVLLDTNFGTYPYVTSSGTTAAGIVAGVDGLPITAITDVIGVFKLPMSRVGKGPFVTRLTLDEQHIHDLLAGEKGQKGAEFGATSGRPRDIGWFDAVAAGYAIKMSGITELALTKLDMYDSFGDILEPVKIATHYGDGEELRTMPPRSPKRIEECRPVYEQFKPWSEPTAKLTKYEKLPDGAKNLIERIEEHLVLDVKYIGTGPDRKDLIVR